MTGMVIYEYTIKIENFFRDSTTLDIPVGGEPLSVQMQRGIVILWVKIPDVEAPVERRVFRALCSGHSYPDPGPYIGTVVVNDEYSICHGDVYHIFEQTKVV